MFSETFTYELSYKVDGVVIETYPYDLIFNSVGPEIICNEKNIINTVYGIAFEHDIPFSTSPYNDGKDGKPVICCPAKNIYMNMTDWPDANALEKTNSTLSAGLITGQEGMKDNEGILRITGTLNKLPKEDIWGVYWDSSNISLEYKVVPSGKPVSTKEVDIDWKFAEVKIDVNSPLNIKYVADKTFEKELPVSAVIVPQN